MKRHYLPAALMVAAALACNALPAGGGPTPTASPAPSVGLEGDCLGPINAGDDILLQVTEGIIEIRDEQFISVAAEITNPTDIVVSGVTVWVRMCDASGQTLLNIEDRYAFPSYIEPGGTVPFHLLRDVANTPGGTLPAVYKLDAVAFAGNDGRAAELVDFSGERVGDQVIVRGAFHNTGTTACLSPSVVLGFYRGGKLHSTTELSPADISEIPVGESSPIDDYWQVPEGTTEIKYWPSCQ